MLMPFGSYLHSGVPSQLEKYSVQPKRAARYEKESASIIQMTNLQDADVAMFPAEYQLCDSEDGRLLFNRFTRLAAKAGKPVVVFTGGDLEHPLPYFEGYEFHTSLYRSVRGKNAFAMPGGDRGHSRGGTGRHVPPLV